MCLTKPSTMRMKNVKKKATGGEYVDGHSFEAVAKFKTNVSERDPFYIFSINDRKMNGKMSYAVKCSKVQLRLACDMNDGFLLEEYCFCDGTQKMSTICDSWCVCFCSCPSENG